MKLTDAAKAHLPGWIISDIMDGTNSIPPLPAAAKVRMIDGVVKVTDELGDSEYYYRGTLILQDYNVPSGYYGRWRVGGWGKKSLGMGTLKQAKAFIDGTKAVAPA